MTTKRKPITQDQWDRVEELLDKLSSEDIEKLVSRLEKRLKEKNN